MSALTEYKRLAGIGPSLMMEAAEADPMLELLATAFSTKVRPADIRFIRYRKAKHGVEMEDQAERLGGILTSIEKREAEPREVIAYLKKHGAKPMADEEEQDEAVEVQERWTLTGRKELTVWGRERITDAWKAIKDVTKETVAQVVEALKKDPAILERYVHLLVSPSKPKVSKLPSEFPRDLIVLGFQPAFEGDEEGQGQSDDAGWAARRHAIDFTGKSQGDVGHTILQQMGGAGRLKAMIGAHTFMTHPDGLSFKFPNPKATLGNYVKVTLTPDDLYDMEFSRLVKYEAKPVKKYSGLPFDKLIPVFQRQTGLRLHL